MPKSPQNYEVLVYQFGAYPQGSVIPEYEARLAGPVGELVARQILAATSKPVNVELAPRSEKPEPVAAAAAPQEVIDELNGCRKRAEDLAGELKTATAKLEAAETARDDLKAELAKYVEQNGHLSRAVEGLEAERDTLTADLEAARADLEALTAPKPDEPKKPRK